MARLRLTQLFANLDNWPGNLFTADGTTQVTTRSATTFAFRHGDDSNFDAFSITVVGTGFTYLGGVATGGTISRVTIRDDLGRTVTAFDQFAGGGFSRDLSQFAANVFGGKTPDGNGPDPDGKTTWTHLLSGRDTIIGTGGDDNQILVGLNAGNDVFRMFGGDDQIGGSVGHDTIYGGAGFDEITFRETTFNEGQTATRGINANLATGRIVDAWGFTDRIFGIESVEGSRFNDVFRGTANRDEFSGLRGRDAFFGGAEQDKVRYANDHFQGGRFGIVVDLQTSVLQGSERGFIRDGFGNRDTVVDIERVSGTRYNDVFVGSRENNRFDGGEGVDRYDGQGGFDAVDLGRSFADSNPGGVQVNLSRASGQIIDDGFGNTENAFRIEQVAGTDNFDIIAGSSSDNFLEGRNGADILTGNNGADYFFWFDDSELGDNDRITDFDAGGGALQRDRLAFEVENFQGMTGTLRFVNASAATIAQGQFFFRASDETLYWDRDGTGGAGAAKVATLDNVTALSAANFDLFT